ncbi:hypothetical protein B0H16DRAFT_1624922, partial [Mycena metata]
MPNSLPPYWKLNRTAVEPFSGYSNLKTREENTNYAKLHDQSCLITGARARLHASHLLPHVETNWLRNNIHQLGLGGADLIDSAPNLITLRSDLNAQSFDEGEFVIVPFNGAPALFVIQLRCRTGARKNCRIASEGPRRAPVCPAGGKLVQGKTDGGVGGRRQCIKLLGDTDHARHASLGVRSVCSPGRVRACRV